MVSGLAVVWLVIGLGWVIGRTHLLPASSEEVFNRFVYYVALPAFVWSALTSQDVASVLGAPLAVAAVSATLTALAVAALLALTRRYELASVVIAAMCSALANAGYLGIPLAHYILGSSLYVVPVLLFQLAFFTPTFFILAQLTSRDSDATASSALWQMLRNPLLLAALTGIVISLADVRVPSPLVDAIDVLGGAAMPCILVSFGLSLVRGGRGLDARAAGAIALASVAKLVVQPALAYLVGRHLGGLAGADLFAVVAMAGLPTAQNAYLAAFRARAGLNIARGSVLATTVFVTPSLMAIAALLA